MRNTIFRLNSQLLVLILLLFLIGVVLLGLILPTTVIPFGEQNLYNYLRQPLSYINTESDITSINSEVGYIYILEDSMLVSEGLDIITNNIDIDTLLEKMDKQQGNFTIKDRKYYYAINETQNSGTIIAVTNDIYITRVKQDIINTILPIILITFTVIGLTLVIWGGLVVRKIEKLKTRIDNFDDDELSKSIDFGVDDEIKALSLAIEDMRTSLKNQEEYRNQMYQNISHDFKTPLTVIKSYIEAVEDDIENPDTAFEIIKKQTINLEQKVHSLLYLNKLDYMKDSHDLNFKTIDIEKIIDEAIEKFKFQRKEIVFTKNIIKKNEFIGTDDLFETIIDNILQNFMRYTETEIKITIKNNKLILYNDGKGIDPDFIGAMFTPFRKGIKGEFGLGLSIVKKSLALMNYDILVKNHKKGVSFTIYKKAAK